MTEHIDILCVIYANYDLLRLQVDHWNWIAEASDGPDIKPRLLICDATPRHLKQDIPADLLTSIHKLVHTSGAGIDGESHGTALDLLVREAESDIVGIVDSDFFWLFRNILWQAVCHFEDNEYLGHVGVKCYGCAGFYPDWQNILDPRHPDRAGHLAPVCWGMFVDRKLALEHTFVVTAEEAREVRETGWRLREHLIKNDIPRFTLPGYCDPNDPQQCIFKEGNSHMGVHLLKGSAGRSHMTPKIKEYIERWRW